MTTVVTRFPPSPTGYLHIGGARTALFNYLYARQNNGKFVLRIEDTDQARSTQEMTDAILDAMHWLGLDFDEGPFFQSERGDLYNSYVDKLLATGHAYYCSCTPEEVEQMREDARAKGLKPKYNGCCREKNLSPGPGRVVRFKTPLTGKVVFDDIIKGPIAWDVQEMDDFVVRRADGSAIYQMAVVVDDAEMGVTHVIRGDDHQNNTPKQILIYQALGFPLPLFGHVPMILGPDKKKMSKRHGATSVMLYKDMGYLPEAMLSYLVRLGWSHGDDELFTMDELLQKFSLAGLGKSASVFDMDKLNWTNSHFIKTGDVPRLARLLGEIITTTTSFQPDPEYLKAIVPLFQPRAKTLKEMAEQAEFFLHETKTLPYDQSAVDTFLTPETRQHLGALADQMHELTLFDRASLENMAAAYLDQTGLKFKALAQPMRVAITGTTMSPGLFETMEVLGKERTLSRFARAQTL
ncbi:glutamate--tRNA ligase [Desulfovibrionales bacterium]